MLHYPVQTLFNTLPTEAWGDGGGGGGNGGGGQSLTGYWYRTPGGGEGSMTLTFTKWFSVSIFRHIGTGSSTTELSDFVF